MPKVKKTVLRRLVKRLDLVQGDYADPTTWAALTDVLDKHRSKTAVFYMAIPPSMFPTVAESLASVGLNERGRIVVEKPFGRDLRSAHELNVVLHKVFPEHHIFRIDHYLGKESVEDLLVFRFSNTLLEPVWNRRYVRSVQITMSETIGVEGRGAFYDSVGAIRDVFQNHLLQVVVAAGDGAAGRPRGELPAGREGQGVRRHEGARLLDDGARPVRRLPRRGRRRSRLAGRDVRRRQVGDRLVALGRRAVVRPRRQGPWRSRRQRRSSSCRRRRGCCSTRPADRLPERNLVRLRLGKNDGVTFSLQAKTPGPHLDSQSMNVSVDFAAALGDRREAYERLLGDALIGSPRRFAREDAVEQMWRIVDPALKPENCGPVYPYAVGSWGPEEADRILADGDTWFPPS